MDVQVFYAEYDDEGVYLYQAFSPAIAVPAIEKQSFEGTGFRTERMTWIKPSFGWMLYRSGYGRKPGQQHILKIKLPHQALAELLSCCSCCDEGGGGNGRVQWDPERDIYSPDPRRKEPRKLLRRRAIQIGIKGELSEKYIKSIIEIQDVTDLASAVGKAHGNKKKYQELIEEIKDQLPDERKYTPQCTEKVLQRLGMLMGKTAEVVSRLGLGKAELNKTT